MILGITGTDGAGKGTVVEYIVKEKGFVHYSARQLWIDEINRQGIDVHRSNMRIVANELRKKHGDDFLVREYLKRQKVEGATDVVIESIRAVAEAETLKAAGGILLAVDADPAVRYERVQARRSESDQVSYEQFLEHEALEMNDPDPHGMQKAKVINMADYVVTNNTTRKELYTQIELVFRTIHERG